MIRENPYTRLARAAVELFCREGRRCECAFPLPPEMTGRRAGVFVSIHKDGALRGCIGTIAPTQPCIAEEITQNAVSASARDPRFPPVSPEELPRLSYSVDVLEAPERAESEASLDPQRYGVIVTLGTRRGLLLPALEGVETAAEQIAIAMRKAGIPPSERGNITLERFTVTRYE